MSMTHTLAEIAPGRDTQNTTTPFPTREVTS